MDELLPPRLVLVLQATALSGLTQVAVLVTDVGTGKELTAAAAKVKRRVKDWGLTTPSTDLTT